MSSNQNKTLNQLTAIELVTMLKNKECSPSQIVDACLEQIRLRNPQIKAWKFLDENIIQKQLRSLGSIEQKSVLAGIPMAIKDNFDTFDMPTEYGTNIYPGHQTDTDSDSIKILRQAGILFLGKTVTSEFAGPFPGPTLNPHDITRTPGVSSMGSAASVADYMVPLSNGTQTGGSIIRPASLCGIYGYKGSFDHISGQGIKHIKPSIDTVGHFARCLEDIELLRQVLTKEKDNQPLESKAPKNIGICKTSSWHAASHDTMTAINKTTEALHVANYNINEIELPKEFDLLMERSFQIIYSWELREAHSDEIKNHFSRFNPWFRWAINYLNDITNQDYLDALQEAKQTRNILKNIFNEIDVIITPSAIGEAPSDLTEIPKYSFNHLWTLMYVPCINLPFYLSPNSLPIGIQAIGPQNQDRQLLNHCKAIETDMRSHFGALPVKIKV